MVTASPQLATRSADLDLGCVVRSKIKGGSEKNLRLSVFSFAKNTPRIVKLKIHFTEVIIMIILTLLLIFLLGIVMLVLISSGAFLAIFGDLLVAILAIVGIIKLIKSIGKK